MLEKPDDPCRSSSEQIGEWTRLSSEPASEQIRISEVDEHGIAVEAAEIEAELSAGSRINPWLVALWVLGAASVGLFILALLGTAFSYPASYSADYPNAPYLERPWYAALAPFSWMFLIMAFLTVLCSLILHAVFWDRRR